MSENRSRLNLALFGPGILVAATGVGAGDLATGAFAGNKLGLVVLWAVLVGAFLKFVLNEGLARWQLATGETLLEGAVKRFGPLVRIIFLPYLLMWSFFVGAALISASGVALHAILPVFESPDTGRMVFGILQSLLGLILVLRGGFGLFRRLMLACIGVMFCTVVVTAVLICEDWSGVASGIFIPTIPEGSESGLAWTLALMGGVGGTLTVLCYGYWMRETAREGPGSLSQCRWDLMIAYGGTAVFGMAMVVIGDAIPLLPQGSGASLVVRLGMLLEDTLGTFGKWIFLTGAWSAIFSSLFGVWQSVPYLFADFCGKADDRRYYLGYLIALAVVPMLGLVVRFSEIQKIYAISGALFMPLLAVVLLLLNGRREWTGALRNRWLSNSVLLATLALFLLFAWFQLNGS